MSRQLIPISFSIPEGRLEPLDIENKTQLLSTIVPGRFETYIYPEKKYYEEYKKSFFARTHKKGGWDCMRHYEILACGCVPLFTDIEAAPHKTMTHLPRNLLFEARELYEEMTRGITDENMEKYKILCRQFRFHTEQFLTSRRMAEYVLSMANARGSKKVLFLSGCLSADYLRCLTLIGFKHLMGADCHDYPKLSHLYKDHNMDLGGMWGKGITYEHNIEQSARDNELDSTVEDDIRARKYDIVIYGSYTRGMPFYDLVREHYPADKVILLGGEDYPLKFEPYINNGHYYFLREIY